MPTSLLEFFSGIVPVKVRLDFQLRNFMACVSTIAASHPLRILATSAPVFSAHARAQQCHRPFSDNIHLLRRLIHDFRPFPLFSPLLLLGHWVEDLFSHQLSVIVPKHPKKGTALYDQWLLAWRQDTLKASADALHCIGTDASYKGQHIASVAIIVQTQPRLVYQSARPCSAHSSFDGELQVLLDTVEYTTSVLQG